VSLQISVQAYSSVFYEDWQKVIAQSSNGTFMHARSYMDYHKDRFVDASVLVYLEELPVAIFPAHRLGDAVYSHEGLSYGGVVVNRRLNTKAILGIFKALLKYYLSESIEHLYIKAVPSFYHRSSTEWLSYVMFLLGAEIFRTDLSFAIPLPADFSLYSKGRKWGLNKAKRAVLSIREVQDFHPFWQEVLIPNLWERHGVSPVHCVEEIERLAINNIPYIRQFDVFEGDQLVAGMTVYDCSTTAHAQYIAATPRGKALSALDLLVGHLIRNEFSDKAYFDFGIVNEAQGTKINQGLMEWKESFGAKPYVHPFYKVETRQWGALEAVMA